MGQPAEPIELRVDRKGFAAGLRRRWPGVSCPPVAASSDALVRVGILEVALAARDPDGKDVYRLRTTLHHAARSLSSNPLTAEYALLIKGDDRTHVALFDSPMHRAGPLFNPDPSAATTRMLALLEKAAQAGTTAIDGGALPRMVLNRARIEQVRRLFSGEDPDTTRSTRAPIAAEVVTLSSPQYPIWPTLRLAQDSGDALWFSGEQFFIHLLVLVAAVVAALGEWNESNPGHPYVQDQIERTVPLLVLKALQAWLLARPQDVHPAVRRWAYPGGADQFVIEIARADAIPDD